MLTVLRVMYNTVSGIKYSFVWDATVINDHLSWTIRSAIPTKPLVYDYLLYATTKSRWAQDAELIEMDNTGASGTQFTWHDKLGITPGRQLTKHGQQLWQCYRLKGRRENTAPRERERGSTDWKRAPVFSPILLPVHRPLTDKCH